MPIDQISESLSASAQAVAGGLTGANINDQVMASDLLTMSKMSSAALTKATLEAATPQLRSFFKESLDQCLDEHARLTQFLTERGWYKPYATPQEQLQLELRLTEAAGQAAH